VADHRPRGELVLVVQGMPRRARAKAAPTSPSRSAAPGS
jgi:hypothetical protein